MGNRRVVVDYRPESGPTNVGFGRGEERNVLYVTSGKSLYKIQMAKDGYELP